MSKFRRVTHLVRDLINVIETNSDNEPFAHTTDLFGELDELCSKPVITTRTPDDAVDSLTKSKATNCTITRIQSRWYLCVPAQDLTGDKELWIRASSSCHNGIMRFALPKGGRSTVLEHLRSRLASIEELEAAYWSADWSQFEVEKPVRIYAHDNYSQWHLFDPTDADLCRQWIEKIAGAITWLREVNSLADMCPPLYDTKTEFAVVSLFWTHFRQQWLVIQQPFQRRRQNEPHYIYRVLSDKEAADTLIDLDCELPEHLVKRLAECPVPITPQPPVDSPINDEWPPNGEWHFRPGEAAFAGKRFTVTGADFVLLKVLVQANGPVPRTDLIEAVSSDYDIGPDTIRGYLTRLRNALRIAFNLSATIDPIPNRDKGKNAAWELDSASLR